MGLTVNSWVGGRTSKYEGSCCKMRNTTWSLKAPPADHRGGGGAAAAGRARQLLSTLPAGTALPAWMIPLPCLCGSLKWAQCCHTLSGGLARSLPPPACCEVEQKSCVEQQQCDWVGAAPVPASWAGRRRQVSSDFQGASARAPPSLSLVPSRVAASLHRGSIPCARIAPLRPPPAGRSLQQRNECAVQGTGQAERGRTAAMCAARRSKGREQGTLPPVLGADRGKRGTRGRRNGASSAKRRSREGVEQVRGGGRAGRARDQSSARRSCACRPPAS